MIRAWTRRDYRSFRKSKYVAGDGLALGADDSWSNPITGHPDELRAGDSQRIIASNAHSARKVNLRVDATLLDLLNKHIGVTA